jgi:hypothetical protein
VSNIEVINHSRLLNFTGRRISIFVEDPLGIYVGVPESEDGVAGAARMYELLAQFTSDGVARVLEHSEQVAAISTDRNHIPVVRKRVSSVVGLPPYREGYKIVVTTEVALRSRFREGPQDDLLVLSGAITDGDGIIAGHTGFEQVYPPR